VLAEEHPECWGGLLDLDPRDDVAAGAAEIEARLFAVRVEDGVALEGGRRLVPRLARAPLAVPTEPVRCDPERTYLVTGGLGVVGLTSAQWLVERGARRVVLAGRSRPPSAAALAGAAPDSPLGRRRAAIEALEASGAAVDTISLDVTDAAAVAALIEALGRAGVPLGGVVHSVMAGDDGLIVDLTADALFEVMRPKVIGAAVLEQACRGLELDFFVMHASIGGVLGQAGHAGYAAANAYLDVLAHAMRAAGRPATSVDWGVWEGADVDKTVGRARGIQALERRGVAVLERATGLAALDRILLAGRPQAMVAPVDWARFGEVAARTRVPSIARGMLPDGAPTAQAAPRFADSLRELPAEQRAEAMVAHLAGLLSRVLRLDVAQVAADKPMGTLGLESVTALELRKRIEDTLGLKLSTTVMWNFPTPNALAAHLVERLAPGPGQAAPAPRTGQVPVAVAPTGAAVTEEDAVRRLAQRRGGRR
jgi:NAD(P)-dependent dehydrogenase (short-subunit alcohol dehydrogenase family)/acyl carrier protein